MGRNDASDISRNTTQFHPRHCSHPASLHSIDEIPIDLAHTYSVRFLEWNGNSIDISLPNHQTTPDGSGNGEPTVCKFYPKNPCPYPRKDSTTLLGWCNSISDPIWSWTHSSWDGLARLRLWDYNTGCNPHFSHCLIAQGVL